MKYKVGDCLSFHVNGTFLAGVVTSVDRGKYHIALGDFSNTVSPSADYFRGCLLFATKFELGETSFVSVDVITIDPADMDQVSSDVVTYIAIPGFLNASGFTEITNTSELRHYFDAGMDLRTKKRQVGDGGTTGFEIKCLIGIAEFLKNINPQNEFSTIKLYKKVDETIHYWQCYGSSNDALFLVVHWGKLGETGEHLQIKDKTLDEIRETYNAELKKVKSQGYQEWDHFQPMVLQFQTSGEWGAIKDLDFRNEIWEYLDRFLFWTGNGSISGGDIGSGTVNLFFEAVAPELAVKTIVNALKEKKVDRPYIIVLESIESGDHASPAKVLYPENYKGKFSY